MSGSALETLAPARTDGLADLMAMFNDVTGRLEQTQASLRAEVARLHGELGRANEQLERSRRLAALGEMAAGIAHEVRNPLGSIGLYAKMLSDDLSDRGEQRAIAEKIRAAVTGLNGVVCDVLAFARECRPRVVGVPASELFESATQRCADARAASRADVRVEGGDRIVLCDRDLMVQALVNIIRNAFEAMRASPGPVLTLMAERSGNAEAEGVVTLSIDDTGEGIAPATLARMFNPFFTTRATGTGLGLSIVHRIVDAHGGSVRAEPGGSGRGTRFVIRLPAQQTGPVGPMECSDLVIPAESGG